MSSLDYPLIQFGESNRYKFTAEDAILIIAGVLLFHYGDHFPHHLGEILGVVLILLGVVGTFAGW